jgi:hypothetical protein
VLRRKGDGVAVIAVSGGEASLVADLAERADVRLPELAPETVARLRTVLPAFGSIGNPLDTTDRGVYDAQNVYSGSIRALAEDPSVSLVAVVQDCSPGPVGAWREQLPTHRSDRRRRRARDRQAGRLLQYGSRRMHAHVIEPFVGSECRRHAGRARQPAGHRSSARCTARFAPSAEAQTLAPHRIGATDWRPARPSPERESKAFLAAHGIAVTRERLARDATTLPLRPPPRSGTRWC